MAEGLKKTTGKLTNKKCKKKHVITPCLTSRIKYEEVVVEQLSSSFGKLAAGYM